MNDETVKEIEISEFDKPRQASSTLFIADEDVSGSQVSNGQLFSRDYDTDAFGFENMEFKLIIVLSIVVIILAGVVCFWYNYLQRQQRKVTDDQ